MTVTAIDERYHERCGQVTRRYADGECSLCRASRKRARRATFSRQAASYFHPYDAAEEDDTKQFLPVQISVPTKLAVAREQSDVRVAVIWPDIQAGFMRDQRTGALDPSHDRAALDVALQITQHVEPDDVVYLGDNLDLPDWSLKFLRTPEMRWTTQHALVELAWWLGQVRTAAPQSKQVYIEGNHEARISKAIVERLEAGYDLRPAYDPYGNSVLSVEHLLGLDQLNIEYRGPYPLGQVYLSPSLRLHHGEVVRSKSGGTVRAVVDAINNHQGQGHIHRLELAARTAWTQEGPKTWIAFSPGCLCRIDAGIVPSNTARQNWQCGVAVIEYTDDDVHIDLVPIERGRALYGGRQFVARDQAEIVRNIEHDTNFKVS